MNNSASQGWTIDDIVIGCSASAWLKKKNLLPSSWGLNPEQVERIKAASVRLTIMYSPASVLTLQPNPLKDLSAGHLIIVDANAFEHPKLTREENVATMLHEIGHVISEAKPKPSVLEALTMGSY